MSRNFWAITTAVSSIALIAGSALGAPPPADTLIGNQAAATYESGGETFSVQSNLVETKVNEVFGLDLTSDQTKSGAPGGFVFFPHTLTNNGNTDDAFDLSVLAAGGTDDFPLTAIQVFADADQDGQPDSLTPITVTPSILSGDTFGIVVQASIPTTATATQATDYTITATSQNDAAQTVTNTDIINVTTDGIIELQKDQILAVDADGDGVFSIGDTVTVNMTYTNTGLGNAIAVELTDDLPVVNANGDAITLSIVAGSGLWSDTGATALTDAAGNVEGGAPTAQGTSLDFSVTGTTLATALLDTVPGGKSGTISFNYTIDAAPEGVIENIARVETSTQVSTPSNTSPITVSPAIALVLADAAATSATPGTGIDGANLNLADFSETDDETIGDDVVSDTDNAFPGASLLYDLVLTNLGNAADTFVLSAANTDFPLGTTFAFVGADGITPVVGNEVVIPAGTAQHVKVRAVLPTNTPVTGVAADFDGVITATSKADPSKTNVAGIAYSGIIQALPVDLVNTDGAGTVTGGVGNGAVDNGGAAWTTNTVKPGETTVFPLRITVDAGAPTNSFQLLTSTDATFATTSLPTGWTVSFFSNGVEVSSTGAMTPTATTGAVFDYEARVTVPATAVASPVAGGVADATELYFRASSASNGAFDTKLDAVIVDEIVDVSISSDTQVQAAPGGVAVITHTVSNNGNTAVTDGAFNLGGADPFTDTNMTAAVFYDANGNGILDATDPIITNISEMNGGTGLPVGGTTNVFVRVQVPANVGLGLTELGDLAIDTALTTSNGAATDSDPANNSVIDTVTVTSGDVAVTKSQAVDANCDGTPETPYSIARQAADPGACLVYRIVADNTGSTPATGVVINDTIPSYTSLETSCTPTACVPALTIDGTAGTVATLPADEGTGSVATSAPGAGFTLAPGSRAVLTFTVQIDE